MKNCSLVLLCLFLSACLSNPSKEDGFYTWVDERGQVRTVKTPATSRDEDKLKNKNTKKDNNFKPGEFETEEQVQARLKDSKLFVWEENGQQKIIETSLKENSNSPQEPSIKLNTAPSGSYASFRIGEYLPWQEIIGKEISLEQVFGFNAELQRDFVLIDLTDIPDSTNLALKSYIRADTISVPQMVFLSDEFSNVSDDLIPFEYYFPESWHSYGYMSGKLSVPSGAQYLLIYTSTLTEALQLDDKVIKLTNLGKISFEFSGSN